MDIAIAGGGSFFGFGAQADLNLTFGQFDLGPIPLSWGGTVAAEAGFGSDIGLGAGAFFTFDTGFDFGSILKFEWRLGIGLGVAFDLGGYYTSPFGIGIAQYFSWTWWFSNNFGLTAQELAGSTFFGPGLYAYGVGIELKL
jgi:hypothetical protein